MVRAGVIAKLRPLGFLSRYRALPRRLAVGGALLLVSAAAGPPQPPAPPPRGAARAPARGAPASAPAAAPAEPRLIRFGLPSLALSYMPMYIADEQGIFAQHG